MPYCRRQRCGAADPGSTGAGSPGPDEGDDGGTGEGRARNDHEAPVPPDVHLVAGRPAVLVPRGRSVLVLRRFHRRHLHPGRVTPPRWIRDRPPRTSAFDSTASGTGRHAAAGVAGPQEAGFTFLMM